LPYSLPLLGQIRFNNVNSARIFQRGEIEGVASSVEDRDLGVQTLTLSLKTRPMGEDFAGKDGDED
jgi:hypothetical protein